MSNFETKEFNISPHLTRKTVNILLVPVFRGNAGLFRDAGFATFLDGISETAGNRIRHTHGTGNVLIFYSVNRKNLK